MELRQIIQFVAVAEAKNFRRAAERLHMSQPPLSQAIRRLENELKARLLNRTSRSVELTEAGKVFLNESRRLLAQLDSAIVHTQHTAQGTVGKLNVAFTVPWAYEVLPQVLQRFRSANPNVMLSLHELSSSAQMRSILHGALDVGFLRLPPGEAAKPLKTIILRRDRLAAALPLTHPLNSRKIVSLSDLSREPFILPPFQGDHETEQFSVRTQVVNLCKEAGFYPRIAQEATQMQTIVRLVEAGLGVSLIPKWTSRHFSAGVIYRDLDAQSALSRVALAVAWDPANRSPVLSRFLDIVEALAHTPRRGRGKPKRNLPQRQSK